MGWHRLAIRLQALPGAFERPARRRAAIALGLLLCAPAVAGGFALDDHILLDQLRDHASGEGAGSGPFDLFVFADGDPERNARLMNAGAGLPWWTFEEAKGAFLRPLTSLTHALDGGLWPTSAAAMHAHSLLWLAVVILLAARVYLRFIDEARVAGLAVVLFALDEAQAQTAGWIANRNALLATAGGLLVLLAHHRFRREGRPVMLAAGAAALALALLAGEFAVGILGYLAAYELVLVRRPWRQRALALAPYAGVVVAWRILYAALGYGTRGLGSYLDPLSTPGAFAAALPARWSALMWSALAGQPADLGALVPDAARLALAAVAVAGMATLAWLAWPTLRDRVMARFWATGAALAAVPVCATWPSDRLLLFVGLGAMAAVAYMVVDVLAGATAAEPSAPPATTRLRLVAVAGLLLVHLVLAPLQRPARAVAMSGVGRAVATVNASLPNDVAGRTVILANVPSSLFASYLQVMRAVREEPRPRHLHWLAATPAGVRLERTGRRTLRVRPDRGFLDTLLERHYRGRRHVMHAGHRVRLDEMTAEVVSRTADGRPATVDFHFARPLESRDYIWRRWEEGRLVPMPLPDVGQAVTLPSDPALAAVLAGEHAPVHRARATANRNSGTRGVNGAKGAPSSPDSRRKRPW
ncbi:MAG: hypothetical protein ACOC9O_02540 [Myxococcota bacterium]